jgi:hypothetical protein
MQPDQRELRHALGELRINFHRALARRFRSSLPDEGELRRLLAREPDERKVRSLLRTRPWVVSQLRTLVARFLGWWQ